MLGTDELLFGLAMLLLGKRKPGGASTEKPATPQQREIEKAAAAALDDVTDGAKLVARANQSPAQAWVDDFEARGAPNAFAHALARWVGIESSGHPTKLSPKGERGLMQIGAAMALSDGAITRPEWDALISPSTSHAEHARIAMKIVEWLWQRASKHLGKFEESAPFVDRVWYAKLYHQRPVDVRDAKLALPAPAAARELARRWANDKQKLHYLRAANVVAWGTPEPPQ